MVETGKLRTPTASLDQPPALNAWQLVNRIHALLGERHKDAAFEGILTPTSEDFYGPFPGLRVPDIETPVTGILVANEPSIDAIRLAIATGRNCILCRDHPFFQFGEFWASGLDVRMANDPTLKAKRQLIDDHKLVIIRLASLWDTARPKWFSGALARALGWQPEAGEPGDQKAAVYCNIPSTTLTGLAQNVSSSLQAKALRMVGDPDLPVRRVAIIHGLAFPTLVLSQALKDPGVDVILTGTTPEVDFCTTYIRDAITAGRKLGMIQVGYEKSDYPGSVEIAHWLRDAFPGVPIDLPPPSHELCWLA